MNEALSSITLDDKPWAVEWLRRPTICNCCNGTGAHVTKTTTPGGLTMLNLYDCGTCVGQGYGVWFSLN